MVRYLRRRHLVGAALLASLAFNAGFGATYGVRTYKRYCRAAGAGTCLADLARQLDLTAEQRAQMEAEQQRLLAQIDAVRRELTAERERLADLLAASEPDREAIAQQLDRLAAIQRRIQQAVVDHLLEQKSLLRPEQRQGYGDLLRTCVCPRGGRGPESVPGTCDLGVTCTQPADAPCAGGERP